MWASHFRRYLRKLERVQRKALRMDSGFQLVTYEKQVVHYKHFSLQMLHQDGDLITDFRIVSGFDNMDVARITSSYRPIRDGTTIYVSRRNKYT